MGPPAGWLRRGPSDVEPRFSRNRGEKYRLGRRRGELCLAVSEGPVFFLHFYEVDENVLPAQ